MKIFITGGTGLVGSHLISRLLQEDHTITVLSRNIEKAQAILGNNLEFCDSLEKLTSLDEYDAVINLAGEPIAGKRWTELQKQRLCQSRWQITKKLTQLIKSGENPPQIFISGSAIGYYGNKEDVIITEDTEPHEEFTNKLCKAWEAFAMEAESSKTRVCLLRTGIVLSSKGGMLAKILPIFKLGLGGTMGSGKQYISWIHIEDMVGIINFLLTAPHIKGAVNMTSPSPVTNKEFSKTLAKVLKRPCIFNVPSVIISLFMGEASTLLLDGQCAIPKKLELNKYQFRYKDIQSALVNILR
ncbi:TIGR01777 family protein [Dysgonomonas sp. HDW5A]|uniref:TIGR01777 family oxidoreductase n=1 Tax=Dysgonomonas sp. HDW5A TaxID=2714926 RepID=UPI00140B6301|nr:TIGR01777 family oxidoreductase [Dysgonomonas sp. HDW5A]QIK59962.1 TIGR01777 family protein [Dysgonomonas sp. HDW5A]